MSCVVVGLIEKAGEFSETLFPKRREQKGDKRGTRIVPALSGWGIVKNLLNNEKVWWKKVFSEGVDVSFLADFLLLPLRALTFCWEQEPLVHLLSLL